MPHCPTLKRKAKWWFPPQKSQSFNENFYIFLLKMKNTLTSFPEFSFLSWVFQNNKKKLIQTLVCVIHFIFIEFLLQLFFEKSTFFQYKIKNWFVPLKMKILLHFRGLFVNCAKKKKNQLTAMNFSSKICSLIFP